MTISRSSYLLFVKGKKALISNGMKYMFSEIGTKDTRAKGIYNSDVKRHWNYPRDTESKAIENIAFPSWNN